MSNQCINERGAIYLSNYVEEIKEENEEKNLQEKKEEDFFNIKKIRDRMKSDHNCCNPGIIMPIIIDLLESNTVKLAQINSQSKQLSKFEKKLQKLIEHNKIISKRIFDLENKQVIFDLENKQEG